MQYIKIIDNIIVEIVSTSVEQDRPYYLLPEGKIDHIKVGDHFNMFDDNWDLRPVKDLVSEGYYVLEKADKDDAVPEGTILEKVKNGEVIRKSDYDLVKEGAIPVETFGSYAYVDDETETIKFASDYEELVNLGKLSYDSYISIKEAEVRSFRNSELTLIDMIAINPLRWNSLGVENQNEISDYRQKMLDITSQSGFPTHMVWPKRPYVIQSTFSYALDNEEDFS